MPSSSWSCSSSSPRSAPIARAPCAPSCAPRAGRATTPTRSRRTADVCADAIVVGNVMSERVATSQVALDEVTALCRRLRLKYVREQVEDVVLHRPGPALGPRRDTPGAAQRRGRGTRSLHHRGQAAPGSFPGRQDPRELGAISLVDPAATQQGLPPSSGWRDTRTWPLPGRAARARATGSKRSGTRPSKTA